MSEIEIKTSAEDAEREQGSRVSLESPTIVERFLDAIPLPYRASLLTAVLFGPPGTVAVRFIFGTDLRSALEHYYQGLGTGVLNRQIAGLILWTGFLFYLMWMVRFLRRRLLAAGPEISKILAGGEHAYAASFQGVSRTLPALGLSAVLILVFHRMFISDLDSSRAVTEAAFHVLRYLVTYLASGTALCVYISGFWGLYRLGRTPLRLSSFAEDDMLGSKPIGSLSLSLSWAYFGLITNLALAPLFSAVYIELIIVILLLTLLGIPLFLMPLLIVHRQLSAVKDTLAGKLRRETLNLKDRSHARSGDGLDQQGLTAAASDLRDLMLAEAVARRVDAMPTWPFDTKAVRGVAAIALSILVAVLTNFALHRLGLCGSPAQQ